MFNYCNVINNKLHTVEAGFHCLRSLLQVYTVAQESKYLLIQNVPAVGAKDQLARLLSTFGTVTDLHPLDDYPADKFTEVYLVKYQRIQSARYGWKWVL